MSVSHRRRPLSALAPSPHLVVVGNGMAAIRTIEELLGQEGQPYRISVYCAEGLGHYNRVLLSSVLAGDKSMADIITHPPDWYEARGVTLHRGDPVIAIDPADQRITTANGTQDRWDRLILATGAQPVIPPLPGAGLDNVLGFRDARDVERMLHAARAHRHAVVIGGGVLGLEAAWGLKVQGMDVTVVHMMPQLMDRQLDETAGEMLRRELEQRGIRCLTGVQALAVHGTGRADGVELSDGSRLPADLVVMAVGIRPRTGLAEQAGLAVGRGVIVDPGLGTSHPAIFAVGECVEFQGTTFGLVKPLYDMAHVLARRLAGADGPAFAIPAQSTMLKIPGLQVFSAGACLRAGAQEREVVHHDPDQGIYKKLVLRDGRIVGTVMIGDTAESGQYWQWMRQGADVGHLCSRSLCRGCAESGDGVAQMPDDQVVCHCNQITKGAILAAIAEQSLQTLEQVTQATRAGVTCGQCSLQVARLLALSQGGAPPDLDAMARQVRRQHLSFTVWHRVHASLMTILVLTGLGLHFPHSLFGAAGFSWSVRLHEWSGLALVGAFLGFLGLTRRFSRRWPRSLDSAAMFLLMPAIVVTGIVFLWPSWLGPSWGQVRTVAWVSLVHSVFAVLILMYLIHHLSHAPFVWWRKQRQHGAAASCFGRLFLRKGYANEN